MSGSNIYRRAVSGVVCLLALVNFGCFRTADAPEEKKPEAVLQEAPVIEVDPLALAQDTIPVSRLLETDTAAQQSKFTSSVSLFPSGDRMTNKRGDSSEVQLFRVQLLTIETYSDARRALAVAQEVFDQPVTLDYEVPYYKLRVGAFRERREAELYQQKAQTAGYPNAWVLLSAASVRQIQPMYQLGEQETAGSSGE